MPFKTTVSVSNNYFKVSENRFRGAAQNPDYDKKSQNFRDILGAVRSENNSKSLKS